jgi:hypothetical protein
MNLSFHKIKKRLINQGVLNILRKLFFYQRNFNSSVSAAVLLDAIGLVSKTCMF